MKLTSIYPLLMLVAMLFLTGCERDANDIDINVSSKLVMFSYISPQDTMLVVQLQKTQPAIGKKLSEEQLKVKNASVTIASGSSEVRLTYNPNSDHYEANAKVWPIVAGKTYQLKVETPDGHKAEASCTIPLTDGIEITEINAPYTIAQDYGGSNIRKYNVTFKWRDAPGVKNYYRTLAYKQYSVSNSYGPKQVYREGLQMDWNRKDLHNDEKNQQDIMVSNTFTYYEYSYDMIDKPFHIYGVLVVGDRNYYLYHESLYKQNESDGNPFAEPAIMYTNVTGGLGVFAGYNQVVASKELQ